MNEFFSNDDNGDLHKIEDWFEFDDSGDNMLGNQDATLGDFTTTGGVKKTACWNWRRVVTASQPARLPTSSPWWTRSAPRNRSHSALMCSV
ncbi:MAG: hypothetical protein U1F83_05590 [Verrucomicrobiota bacterium]